MRCASTSNNPNLQGPGHEHAQLAGGAGRQRERTPAKSLDAAERLDAPERDRRALETGHAAPAALTPRTGKTYH